MANGSCSASTTWLSVSKIVDAAFAANADDKDRRQDRERAGNQSPNPGREPPVHEAFHHDLAGERAGDRAALTAGQEGNGEQDARRGGAQERSERQIRDANPIGVGAEGHDLTAGDRHALAPVEHHRGQHEDGGVDEERDAQRDRGIDRVEADCRPNVIVIGQRELAALHQAPSGDTDCAASRWRR